MTQHLVVLGGGTAGTLIANRVRRLVAVDDLCITVVDQNDEHVYQPGLLFVPFGRSRPDQIVHSRRRQLRSGINYRQAPIDHVDLDRQEVLLQDGAALNYDVLVVATGARLAPEETEGLTGPGWGETVFTFYDLPSAVALREALARFDEGRLIVNVVDMPIKCPVAPLEFAFLADWFFHKKGIRSRVEMVYATPLDGAFTKPVASRELGGLLADKGIELVTEFNTGKVDGEARTLTSYDGRQETFDIAVIVPLHVGADYVGRSAGLGDELNFVPCDEHTLQVKAAPNVFAMGDAAALPASKAGSVAHFEGEFLAENIVRFLAHEPLDSGFDGHTNCFIESGFGKALLVDFNYDTEPLGGYFPARIGLPLLRESYACHLGKLAFEPMYWHVLLPGRSIPGVPAAMSLAGKQAPSLSEGS